MAIREDDKVADPKTQAEHYSKGFAIKVSDFAGQCHMDMDQYTEALKHYDIAIKKDPLNGNYYFNRGIVKKKLERLEKAIEDFKKAIDNHQD